MLKNLLNMQSVKQAEQATAKQTALQPKSPPIFSSDSDLLDNDILDSSSFNLDNEALLSVKSDSVYATINELMSSAHDGTYMKNLYGRRASIEHGNRVIGTPLYQPLTNIVKEQHMIRNIIMDANDQISHSNVVTMFDVIVDHIPEDLRGILLNQLVYAINTWPDDYSIYNNIHSEWSKIPSDIRPNIYPSPTKLVYDIAMSLLNNMSIPHKPRILNIEGGIPLKRALELYFTDLSPIIDSIDPSCIENTDKLPYKSDTFDIIVCSFSLNKIRPSSIGVMMNELNRTMKASGYIIIQEYDSINDVMNSILTVTNQLMVDVLKIHKQSNRPSKYFYTISDWDKIIEDANLITGDWNAIQSSFIKKQVIVYKNINQTIDAITFTRGRQLNRSNSKRIYNSCPPSPSTYKLSNTSNKYIPAKAHINNIPIYKHLPIQLLDNAPSMAYHKHTNKYTNTIEWPARERLIVMINLICKYISAVSDTPQQLDSLHIQIVYVASNICIHIPVLCKLFPQLVFNIYNAPRTFQSSAHTHTNLQIHSTTFNDKICTYWRDYNQNNNHVILITDINMDNRECAMHTQKKWYNNIEPAAAIMRVNLPWRQGQLTFPDGDIYFHPYGYPSATSTTMYVDGRRASTILDYSQYEKKMFYFNQVIRSRKYQTVLSNNNVSTSTKIDNIYDNAYEIQVWSTYLSYYYNHNNKIDIIRYIDNTTKDICSIPFVKLFNNTLTPRQYKLICNYKANSTIPNYDPMAYEIYAKYIHNKDKATFYR